MAIQSALASILWLLATLAALAALIVLYLSGLLAAALAEGGRGAKPLAPLSPAPITSMANDQLRPVLAYNSDEHEYLVVFEHVYNSSDHDTYARRLYDDATPIADPFAVITWEYDQVRPRLAHNERNSTMPPFGTSPPGSWSAAC